MFSHFLPLVFRCMPSPERFSISIFGRKAVLGYRHYYHRCEKAVISYHKSQLRELDFKFKLSEASQKLVPLRKAARAKGIGPGHPEYPELYDVIEDPLKKLIERLEIS